MPPKDVERNESLLPAEGGPGSGPVALGDKATAPSGKNPEFFSIAKYILACELCERLAFYGITGNLVLFFTDVLGHSSPTADAWNMVFSGTCYLTPLLGGWLADTKWDRYNTILRFSSIYFIGLVLLAVSSVQSIANDVTTLVALLLVSLGTGGIKSSVSVLGAEQTDDTEQQQSFFNYFYWAINLGSMIAFTAVVGIQQNVDFTAGYSIPAVAMGLAVISFWWGRAKYKVLPPQGSVITEILSASWSALKLNGVPCCGKGLNWKELRASNGGPVPDRTVGRLRTTLRILPIMATFVGYWLIYSQMASTFFNQGKLMNLSVGAFDIPVAFLQSFDVVIILVMVPIFDRYLYPYLKSKGLRLTMLRRIGLGYCFTIVAMVIASVVETQRRDMVESGHVVTQKILNKEVIAGDMSIFWQVPQFLCIGTSEVLASISGLEFAFDQAPKSLRGVIMAIFLLATAFGNYTGALVISIVNAITQPNPWIPDNINDGHLDLYFLLLGGLAALNFLVYLVLALRYRGVEGASAMATGDEDEDGAFDDDNDEGSFLQNGDPMSPALSVHAQARATGEHM